MGKGDAAQCVKVAIRCRPPSSKELANNEHSIVEMKEAFIGDDQPGQVILTDPSGNEEPAEFAFDIVFGLTVLQATVYESVGRPALTKTFEGYNGTIFAYGQTGSGKSWSMCGAPDPELQGITPRVNEELFTRIAKEQVGSTRRFLVMCSYFEIYNEIIFDLLNPVADRSKLGGGLQIKEHPVMGIYVKDLTEIVAEEAKKLEEMLESGQKSRAVSSTMMNATSSRSHSIFTIKVHQKDEEDTSRNVFAKLNLVDLAGSERQKGTQASGQTLKEGANINKSLSALGNVINALVEGANGKKVFIPYRNSKLTRVLQESLGGNSLCTMLATLSPAACNYEETMSTLRYANRAKSIKVSATKNEEASQISRLKAEVEELKKKLESAGTGGVHAGAGGLTEAEREAEKAKFQKQLAEMEEMMSGNWEEKAKLSEEHEKKIAKIKEDRKRAAKAIEEERNKRLRLLQEKNDLELSLRGLTDFLLHLPKYPNAPPVLSGEQPRHWLKVYRSLRQHIDELKEQRTLALVFKHAFDEDVRLWGEGAEADDTCLAATGLNRCQPKLHKLRKGGEKLLQLESQGLSTASELAEAVRLSMTEAERFRQLDAEETAEGDVVDAEAAAAAAGPGKVVSTVALEEVSKMLHLVLKQLQEKIDELAHLASIEVIQTCQIVAQFSRSCLGEGHPGCDVLQALIKDPCLAALPASMPAKPLREYEPSDVLDTPETTEALLGLLIRWEGLCGGKTRKTASELLSRPPPKFILDVTLAVKIATGFPPDIEDDWPEARDERLARFQHIASAVGGVLGIPMDFFDPTDVLRGKEVGKTLRLMQLLAIAAARNQPLDQKADGDGASPRLTHPRELPAVLNAMDRCITAAKEQVDKKRDSAVMAVDGERSLEEKIQEVEDQLREEARARSRQEDAVQDTERQLQESQAEVKKVMLEKELTLGDKGGALADPEMTELERQMQELQDCVAAPADLPAEAFTSMLAAQLQEVQREITQDEQETSVLSQNSKALKEELDQAVKLSKRLEAEVQRERQKRETEMELIGQSPEEQKLILETHQKKQRTRVETLDQQAGAMQIEFEERKATNLQSGQKAKDLEAKVEDVTLQMQIVLEERDAMREAMEQLWDQKAIIDEELQDRQQGYINLSERLNIQQDESCELECLVEQRRQEVASLQKNGFHMP